MQIEGMGREGWGRAGVPGIYDLSLGIPGLFFVVVLLLHFTTLGVGPLKPMSSIKLGDFSSLLLSCFLEKPSHKQKSGLARMFSGC